jgi:hypothetical protein
MTSGEFYRETPDLATVSKADALHAFVLLRPVVNHYRYVEVPELLTFSVDDMATPGILDRTFGATDGGL